jgi:phosphoglycerol transferase
MLRLLAFNTSHYPSVLNNFFLLTFPLVFLSAFWVLRHFGVRWWTGVCVSLLYAFAPLHFTRGEHHLFLSAYWPVPLAVLVTLWLSGDGFRPGREGRSAWRSRKLWLSVLICLVLAATGFYYAFFACFFFLVASASAAVRQRSWRGLWPGLGLIAVISAGVVSNLLPTLLHFEEHGTVPVVQRVASDADAYGLRIAQLLLPVRGHRLQALEDVRAEYNRRPLINENDDVSLGLAGALGFVGLLWWFFFRKPAAEGLSERGTVGLLHHLSIFNLAGLLLGTMGGFGSLVAFFGLPQVRAYNRVSVFLSFFAFFALALWLDNLTRRYAAKRARAVTAGFALAVVTVLALCDQISPRMLPDYRQIKAEFTSDAVFVREIEQNVPHGALILQLPFMTFPESAPAPPLEDYDLLRGYLHSDHLRWTYGTVRGREGHAWMRQAVDKPADQLVETLAWAGFGGVYLDRNGFDDNGAQIEAELRNVLRDLPIHSPDERRVFYNLAEYRARLEQRTPSDLWEARREAAVHPPLA